MVSELDLARLILDVVPPSMHRVRRVLRDVAGAELTIPQLRILAQISRGLRYVGQLAEHHGVSQPAMSKMVDGLVRRGLIEREAGLTGDRRQVSLKLTARGDALYKKVRQSAQWRIGQRLAKLSREDRRRLQDGLEALRAVFLGIAEAEETEGKGGAAAEPVRSPSARKGKA